MSKKTVKNFIKIIIGKRLISFYRTYAVVPVLLFNELHRIIRHIRLRQRYAEDPEVLLCGLRTCAHIVDKGLQSDNWQEGRGQAAYKRLCKQIERVNDLDIIIDPSYQWACGKKTEYEEIQKLGSTGHHPIEHTSIKTTKDDLQRLMQSRRSIRSFEDRSIAPEILKELANVMNWSPTSCNRQPAKLFITQNPEKVTASLKQCAGATCFGGVTPCFIAVCADTRFYMLKDRNLPFIDVSLGLQNMLLLAHLQGIEGTPLNWMHHTSKENAILREVLNIPEHYLIILNLVMGYPVELAPAPGRKSCDLGYVIVD